MVRNEHAEVLGRAPESAIRALDRLSEEVLFELRVLPGPPKFVADGPLFVELHGTEVGVGVRRRRRIRILPEGPLRETPGEPVERGGVGLRLEPAVRIEVVRPARYELLHPLVVLEIADGEIVGEEAPGDLGQPLILAPELPRIAPHLEARAKRLG